MALESDLKTTKKITLTFEQSTRTAILAKLFLLLLLGSLFGYLASKSALKSYEKSEQISLEKCAETLCTKEINDYKTMLAQDQSLNTLPAGIAAMTLGLLILAGAYELSAFLIGLMIGKIVR
ncbi:MAG: hypothetical protein ACRC8A_04865 [Microcoleaceae cyanobacterium]